MYAVHIVDDGRRTLLRMILYFANFYCAFCCAQVIDTKMHGGWDASVSTQSSSVRHYLYIVRLATVHATRSDCMA
jgi:hypothetical protein